MPREIGAPQRGPGEARSLQDLLHGFDRHGAYPALFAFTAEGCETLTFAALKQRSLELAGALMARGLAPGEPVALFATNCAAWVVCRLALIAADALCVPIDFDADAARVRALLEDSGATRMFTTAALRPTVDAAVADMAARPEVFLLDHLPSGDPPPALPAATGDAPVSIFYTSGTTGPPKAVPLTHRNILTNVGILHDLGLIGPGDRVCLPLPLHHSYPFIVGMLLPLYAGAAMVLPEGVSGPQLVRALSQGGATVMVGVPRLYEAMVAGLDSRVKSQGMAARAMVGVLLGLSTLLRRRFGVRAGRRLLRPLHRAFAPHLRLLASGGAKLRAETGWTLESLGYQVLTGYGLVETTSIATYNRPGAARFGSAGQPSPAVEMRLRPIDGLDLPEIQFRGPIVFSGYRNNPAANAEAFTPDGWFRTGDLGWQDDDGYLYIGGRSKEMIILPGGKNVAPEEVEAVYGQSAFIAEIAVLEQDGRLVAIVVPDLDAFQARGAGRMHDQVRVDLGRLGAALPAYARISDFVTTRHSLPRNQLGKYRRHELPALYAQAERGATRQPGPLSEADRRALSTPRARRLMDWLAARFPDAPRDPDASLQMELGIDSLAWVDLSLDLERRLGVSLPENRIADLVTVRDLIQAVEDAPAAGADAGPAPDWDRWLAPPPAWAQAAGRVAHVLAHGLCRILFRLRVTGRHNLSVTGPTILAANHTSDIDPLVLAAALPYAVARTCWWGGDATRVFGTRAGRLLARVAQVFPVDDRAPSASLDRAVTVLERGGTLIWFPEEWRSPDGRLQPFRPGIGALIARSRATVIPVEISGTFQAMPRTARLPRPHPVTVRIGTPIPAERLLPTDASPSPRDQAIADRLHETMKALAAE